MMVWYSGDKIRSKRLERGQSIYALAVDIGISADTMKKVEAGTASACKVKQVATFLKIPMRSLLKEAR